MVGQNRFNITLSYISARGENEQTIETQWKEVKYSRIDFTQVQTRKLNVGDTTIYTDLFEWIKLWQQLKPLETQQIVHF